MKNNNSYVAEFLNTKLYECLTSFSETLPKDALWHEFRTLIEALKFALLNGENPVKLSKRIRRERYKKEPSLIPLSEHGATLDIAEVKRLRKLAKATPLIPGARKLDPYRQEIIVLRKNGASQMDIKYWLLASKGVASSQPTIHRYLTALESNG